MKAEFYLTLLDGLLATAVYYPRKPATSMGMPRYWTVPVGEVSGTSAWRLNSSITSLSGEECRPAPVPAGGVSSSATPVCGFRLSLHC